MEYQTHSAHNIAFTSCGLGIVIGSGLALLFISGWTYVGVVGVYMAMVALYHMLEYLCVALYNPTRIELDSFMFNPDGENLYPVTLAVSLVEYIAECWMNCSSSGSSGGPGAIAVVGLFVATAGQVIRTLAMVTAKSSFNHIIADRRENDHTLITHGIYSYERHPSYVGFFLWAVGLQVMLRNPISCFLFVAALSYFFIRRVNYEERTLKILFGQEYDHYMRRTPTCIPKIDLKSLRLLSSDSTDATD
ncbi:farnesyl cysteine-carboxyl methyltransferase [Coemansia sp. RSA 2607]|nr:farnesyl cysteine-carboxyl methyltransferase [Coemansia sp. RSA 2607]